MTQSQDASDAMEKVVVLPEKPFKVNVTVFFGL